jgi:hypothetical protein
MNKETCGAVIARVRAIESEVSWLREAIAREELAESDRQYLSRCFDLLTMELDAVCQYLQAIE